MCTGIYISLKLTSMDSRISGSRVNNIKNMSARLRSGQRARPQICARGPAFSIRHPLDTAYIRWLLEYPCWDGVESQTLAQFVVLITLSNRNAKRHRYKAISKVIYTKNKRHHKRGIMHLKIRAGNLNLTETGCSKMPHPISNHKRGFFHNLLTRFQICYLHTQNAYPTHTLSNPARCMWPLKAACPLAQNLLRSLRPHPS